MEKHFQKALKNIATHGDTDVFPYPIENIIFYDKENEIISLLCKIHENFEEWINRQPPFNENELAPVGYNGFRWVTQLDPLWNAYFLGLIISIGEKIEAARIPINENRIFSYRFIADGDDKLFNQDLGWQAFHRQSLQLAHSSNAVVICDISDFYQRIRHHRLENALKQLKNTNDIPKNIIKFLEKFSGTYSHGLPIGGPAARLLSELLLNQTDQLLRSQGIQFCRFADDYHLFASSEDEAYDHLLFLSKKLLTNEGLVLQKAKTRIMSSHEFRHTSPLAESQTDEINSTDTKAFLSLSLKFDPYSITAEDDYEALKAEVARFDVIGLLRKEIAKTRIDIAATKQIIRALKFIDEPIRDQAVLSICNSLSNLYPIFPTVVVVLKQIWKDVSDEAKIQIGETIRLLFNEKSHLIKTEVNQLYACRLLSHENRQENIELFQKLFNTTESQAIKRDILLAMFNWRYSAWLSDLRSQYTGFTPPLKRAFIIGIYGLSGDEGKHWRKHNKDGFSEFEQIIHSWACEKANGQKDGWEVPL